MNNKKKKLNKSQIISRIVYIVSALIILSIIPYSKNMFYDYYSQLGRQKGYTVQDLYDSFIGGEYGQLIEKTEYNIGVGRKITAEDANYYAFAKCYDSAMDYHMYDKTGQKDKAEEVLSTFRENESKLNGKIFEDAIENVRKTYEIAN